MPFFKLAILHATILGAIRILALPTDSPPIIERAGTGTASAGSGLAGALGPVLKGLNKGPNLQCCGVFPQECYGWVQPDLGTWDVCYSKTGNVYTWAQDDVNVANCLINLHYTQDDACISVAGSECEQYAKGSMIINSWVGASAYRFNADDSDTLQAASTAFLGTKFSTTSYEASGGEVTFSRVGQNVYQSAVTIRFAGDESC